MMTYESSPGLRCDGEHKYWRGTESLIGVTEVVVEVGLENADWFTETDSSRGRAIHAVLAGAAGGQTFDWDKLDADLHGWVRSGLNFLDYLRSDGAAILGVEVMRDHALYKYAGTIDLVVSWRGYEWILDWKSGKAAKVTPRKLAAYDWLLPPAGGGKARKRAAVEIQRDGRRAKLVEYNGVDNYNDGARFLSYLTTARDRREARVNKPLTYRMTSYNLPGSRITGE